MDKCGADVGILVAFPLTFVANDNEADCLPECILEDVPRWIVEDLVAEFECATGRKVAETHVDVLIVLAEGVFERGRVDSDAVLLLDGLHLVLEAQFRQRLGETAAVVEFARPNARDGEDADSTTVES